MNRIKFVFRTVDGHEYRYPKLTVYNRADILSRLKSEARQRLVDNLATAGLAGDVVFTELERFDETPWEQPQWLAHIGGYIGQAEIVKLSIDRLPQQEREEAMDALSGMGADEWFRLVVELCGLKLAPRPLPTTGETRTESPTDSPSVAA